MESVSERSVTDRTFSNVSGFSVCFLWEEGLRKERRGHCGKKEGVIWDTAQSKWRRRSLLWASGARSAQTDDGSFVKPLQPLCSTGPQDSAPKGDEGTGKRRQEKSRQLQLNLSTEALSGHYFLIQVHLVSPERFKHYRRRVESTLEHL